MLSNCSQCQYFNHNPHHSGDVVCANDPAYAFMWQRLNSLDQYTLDSIPVDNCREFELNPSLKKHEISLSLTFEQWKAVIFESHCPTIILKSLRNHAFQHSLSLTLQQWQAIGREANPLGLILLAYLAFSNNSKHKVSNQLTVNGLRLILTVSMPSPLMNLLHASKFAFTMLLSISTLVLTDLSLVIFVILPLSAGSSMTKLKTFFPVLNFSNLSLYLLLHLVDR